MAHHRLQRRHALDGEPCDAAKLGQMAVLRGHPGRVQYGAEHDADEQCNVGERAEGVENWNAGHGGATQHARDQGEGRAPEPVDEATAHPRAENCGDDAARGRDARPGSAPRVRQDEPWQRECRHRIANPEEEDRREQRDQRPMSTFPHSSAASCVFAVER
jgi:hypothetical protein